MDLLAFLLLLALVGIIVGGLARLALPGPDPMSIWMTIGIGLAGSLISGFITHKLLGRPGSFLLSFLCAVGLVYLVRRSRRGGLTHPGFPPGR